MSRRAGQIQNRGPNVWLVRVYRGREASGKRRYLNKTIHGTKRQAQEWLTRTLHELSVGIFAEPSKQTLGQYLSTWLEGTARQRVSGRTYRDYTGIVRRYVEPALGGARLSDVAPADVQALYAGLTVRGLSPTVVRHTHAVLRSALKQAVRWNLLYRNPCDLVDLPRLKRRELRYLAPDEAKRFLESAREDKWYALWMVLLYGGLRPGEAAGLKWADLDSSVLHVQRSIVFGYRGRWEAKEPKTPRSRRSVPIPGCVVEALREHRVRQAKEQLASDSEYRVQGFVFTDAGGDPVNVPDLRSHHFDPILEGASLPHLRIYDLRHTCATLMLAGGTNPKVVSERLGHSSITITMDTYSAVLPTLQEEATDTLERLIEGSG